MMKQNMLFLWYNFKPIGLRYCKNQSPFNVISSTFRPLMGSRSLTSSVKLKVINNFPKTFQEVIFQHLNKHYHEKVKHRDHQVLVADLEQLDTFFVDRSHGQVKPISSSNDIYPKLSTILPVYIRSMKSRKISTRLVTVIDLYCHDILDFELHRDNTLSALDLLNAWLQFFYPQLHRVQELQCYGKLLRQRGREVFQNFSSLSDKSISNDRTLIHLAFVAGIGKKNLFESHEVLSQLGTLCDINPEITYQNWNPFDLAVACVSFFKGGIKMDSERFLSHISKTLCQILSETLARETDIFNPYVVISLLKMLRQANYVEEKLLRLLSELILSQEHEKKVRNIGFLTNIVSAVTGPGRQLDPGSTSDLSVVKVLNRMEHLVVDIIRGEEDSRRKRKDPGPSISRTDEGVDSSMKSRLKDISRWLWATGSSGYQISPEDYQADLSRRFFSGEFTKRASDAVDALLALVIMNHYLDDIVMKVLHSPDFRSALRVKCLQRHKGRFGLFLTSVKIERNDLWRQLSGSEIFQLMEIVGPPKSETEGWKSLHLPIKKKRDKTSGHSTLGDYKPHSELLNQCMDALNVIFTASKIGGNNDFRNDNGGYKNTIDASSFEEECQRRDEFSQIQVLQGYAVPYLHIPGIKVIFPNVGKELCLEVVGEETILPGLHQLKLRLMSQMGYIVFKVTREEIEQCPDVPSYFEFNIRRILNT